MNRRGPWPAAALALVVFPALAGCISTVANVVTAPVRIAGKAVDLATTSQSEADEKRGRDMRRSEERLGSLERSWRKHQRQCREGDDDACDDARRDRADMDDLLTRD